MNAFLPPPAHQAFTLVEVTLALGIAVFCLVVIFGLMSVGLNTSSISVQQTSATNVLSGVVNDLRATPRSVTTSVVYQVPLLTAVPVSPSPAPIPTPTPAFSTPVYLDASGQPDANLPNAAYQLNVWLTPGTGRNATVARVLLTWPPGAAPASASGSVETVVALDRN